MPTFGLPFSGSLHTSEKFGVKINPFPNPASAAQFPFRSAGLVLPDMASATLTPIFHANSPALGRPACPNGTRHASPIMCAPGTFGIVFVTLFSTFTVPLALISRPASCTKSGARIGQIDHNVVHSRGSLPSLKKSLLFSTFSNALFGMNSISCSLNASKITGLVFGGMVQSTGAVRITRALSLTPAFLKYSSTKKVNSYGAGGHL
mmetsp:Transcript_13449/g.20410  ORF Transcript_13449/g.20410 Transcript_13449/m.20410 type:complete len:206 (+) Transcript_13449:282-899(+)